MKYFYIFFISSFIFGQSQNSLYQSSIKSYQDQDYKNFLILTQKLDSLRPSHPTYTYNLACAYALNNQLDNAFISVQKCVLNNNIDFESEKDLINLKKHKDYNKLIELKAKQNQVVASSIKSIILSEKDFHPEGFIYLKKNKIWLSGSIRKRKIVSFDEFGKCIDWLKDKSFLSIVAMKADKNEKTLWVAASAFPEMENYNASLQGKSEVLQIDIKSKRIIQRFSLIGNHFLGDILVTKRGDVFVSDSGEAIIHKIENGKLVPWLDLKNEAYNLQGITIDNLEETLFIADYLKGILKINIKNPNNRSWLTIPTSLSFKGIDGLTYFNNTLIAIQNGVKPIRIVRFLLDENKEIKDYKILDHNRTEFNEPTLGTIVNDNFYFFANSPWSAYDSAGNLLIEKVNNPELYINKLKP